MDGASKQRESLKENVIKTNTYTQNQKERVQTSLTLNVKEI